MITYTNIPRYLSDNIEHTQRRALSIILPDLKYREALIETDLEPLYERREKLCKKLFTSIENDSYHKIHGLLPPLNITTLCTDQIETSTSLPPGKPRAFDYFLCPGSGEFDLYLGGVGKIEPEVSGFK